MEKALSFLFDTKAHLYCCVRSYLWCRPDRWTLLFGPAALCPDLGFDEACVASRMFPVTELSGWKRVTGRRLPPVWWHWALANLRLPWDSEINPGQPICVCLAPWGAGVIEYAHCASVKPLLQGDKNKQRPAVGSVWCVLANGLIFDSGTKIFIYLCLFPHEVYRPAFVGCG